MRIEEDSSSEANVVDAPRFIQRFVQVMADVRPAGIEAFGIGGSFGNQDSADVYSDLDFFLLVHDSFLRRLSKSSDDFIRLFGDYLLSRGPVFVPNYGYSVSVLYRPFLCCQFNFNTRRTLTRGPIRKHTRILHDPIGFYTDFTQSQRDATFDSRDIFLTSCSLFWFRVINVWRDLERGHHWFAIRHLVDVQRQMLILLRLKCSKDPADFFFAEKNLENDLGSDVCEAFAPMLAGYSAESISNALRFCVGWYSDEASSYAATHDVIYPSAAANQIVKIIGADIGR